MISMIAAVAQNRVIGRAGRLPWRLPADIAHFKQTTLGKAVIMGRKTFDSIGRALPERDNLVLSRSPGFSPPGCTVVGGVDEAIQCSAHHDEVVVIGGSSVYEAFLPRTDRLYLTRIHAEVEGDVCFPHLDLSEWTEVGRREVAADARHAYAFSIITLERRRDPPA